MASSAAATCIKQSAVTTMAACAAGSSGGLPSGPVAASSKGDTPPVKKHPFSSTRGGFDDKVAGVAASRVPHVPSDSENALATFLDIAVLRCLFVSHWPEEGVYWALTFFNKR